MEKPGHNHSLKPSAGMAPAVVRVMCWGAGGLALALVVFGVAAVMGRVQGGKEEGHGVQAVGTGEGADAEMLPATRPADVVTPTTAAAPTTQEAREAAREMMERRKRLQWLMAGCVLKVSEGERVALERVKNSGDPWGAAVWEALIGGGSLAPKVRKEAPQKMGDALFLRRAFDDAAQVYDRELLVRGDDAEAVLDAMRGHLLSLRGEVAEHRAQAMTLGQRLIQMSKEDARIQAQAQAGMGDAWVGMAAEKGGVRTDGWGAARRDVWGLPVSGPSEEEVKNLGNAVACYEAAMAFFKREKFAVEWACLKERVGDCWGAMGGEEGREKSVVGYEEAMEVWGHADYFSGQRVWVQAKLARARHLRLMARAGKGGAAMTREEVEGITEVYRQALMSRSDWGKGMRYAFAQRWAAEAWMQVPEGEPDDVRLLKTQAIRQARGAYLAAREAGMEAGQDPASPQAPGGAAVSERVGDLWVMELERQRGVYGPGMEDRVREGIGAGVMAYNDAMRTFTRETRREDWLRVRLKVARLLAREANAWTEPQRLAQVVWAYRAVADAMGSEKEKGALTRVHGELAQRVTEAFGGEAASPDRSSFGGAVRRQNQMRLDCLTAACQSAQDALSGLSLAQSREALEKQSETLEALREAYETALSSGGTKPDWKAGQEKPGPQPTRKMMMKKRGNGRGK